MNIAIVTIYDSINCGNFWQAYAMQSYLEKLGHKVTFIKWKKPQIIKQFINETKSKSLKAMVKKTGTFLAFKKAWKVLNIPNKVNINERFDLIIIGSDELWNINNETFSHTPVFYGIGLNASNIVSYAVSLAQTDYIQIKNNPYFTDLYKNIDLISVRDSHSVCVMKDLGITAFKTVDPTLLIDFSKIIKDTKKLIDHKYVFVYLFSATQEQQKFVNDYAHQLGYKTVSMCMYNQWCDINLSAGPYEFLNLIKNAEIVVSGTFHGTVFSVLFHKKFIVLSSSQNKINDFLESIQLKERITPIKETFLETIQQPIDYYVVDIKLTQMRKESFEYLRRCLE